MPDVTSDLIGRSLQRYGEWGWFETEFVAHSIGDGARVLDVGAFVGTFGLGLGLARRLEFLCAVEANPQITPMLRDNVSDNAGCRHAVIEAVATGAPGLYQIGLGPADNLGATAYAVNGPGDRTSGPAARTVTLADLRRQHGPFDLIKLDIEGMEREVLLGDAAQLASGTTTLWVECNEDRRSLDVARLLLSLDLELSYFAFPSFNPGNVNGDATPIYPWAYEAGLLAAPQHPARLSPELQAAGCILRPIRSIGELKEALWQTPRWGAPEWHGATTLPQLAALVGRSLCDQRRDEFLQPVQGTPAPVQTVWGRLQAMEAGRDEARELILAERRVREAAEGGLRAAQALVHERTAERDVERQCKAAATERADSVEREFARLSARGLAHLARFGQEREQAAAQARTMQAALDDALACGAAQASQLADQALHAEEVRRRAETQVLAAQAALDDALLRLAAQDRLAAGNESRVAEERRLAETQVLAVQAALDDALLRLAVQDRMAADNESRVAEERRLTEARLLATEAALHAIQCSTSWSGLVPLRRVLNNHTRLRRVLRRSLHAAVAIRRLCRPR